MRRYWFQLTLRDNRCLCNHNQMTLVCTFDHSTYFRMSKYNVIICWNFNCFLNSTKLCRPFWILVAILNKRHHMLYFNGNNLYHIINIFLPTYKFINDMVLLILLNSCIIGSHFGGHLGFKPLCYFWVVVLIKIKILGVKLSTCKVFKFVYNLTRWDSDNIIHFKFAI